MKAKILFYKQIIRMISYLNLAKLLITAISSQNILQSRNMNLIWKLTSQKQGNGRTPPGCFRVTLQYWGVVSSDISGLPFLTFESLKQRGEEVEYFRKRISLCFQN